MSVFAPLCVSEDDKDDSRQHIIAVVLVVEVITFIYCRLSRLGDTHKHSSAANVLEFTDREACVTTSFIDFGMSQRVFITGVRV